jgi:hypothetical protein
MRKSRVLLAGVAVAAAAAATSAFTASNTLPQTGNVLGSAEVTVTGATVTDITYVPLAADTTKLDEITFLSSTDVTGQTVTMSLKHPTNPTVVVPCDLGAYTGAVGSETMLITCTATTQPLISSFNTVGLTVAG